MTAACAPPCRQYTRTGQNTPSRVICGSIRDLAGGDIRPFIMLRLALPVGFARRLQIVLHIAHRGFDLAFDLLRSAFHFRPGVAGQVPYVPLGASYNLVDSALNSLLVHG